MESLSLTYRETLLGERTIAFVHRWAMGARLLCCDMGRPQQVMGPPPGFTTYEGHQDVFLGILFLLIAAYTLRRIYGAAFRGRTIILLFNFLILSSALLRAIWFFIPDYYLEPTYIPIPLMAFTASAWKGQLVSQLLLSIGNIAIYGTFVIIECYWMNILQKLRTGELTPGEKASQSPAVADKGSTMSKFFKVLGPLVGLETINVLLFMCKLYNSKVMALNDCILYTVASILIARHMILLSHEMNDVIMDMQIINRSTSRAQARRIHAMMLVSSTFFFSRALFECALGAPILWEITGNASFIIGRYHHNY